MTDPEVDDSTYPYKCDQCSATFMSSYCLQKHKEDTHDHKRYECRTCDVVFVSPKDMCQHELLRHKSEMKVRNRDDNERMKGDLSKRMKTQKLYRTRRDNITKKIHKLRELTNCTNGQTVAEVLNHVIWLLTGQGLPGLTSPTLLPGPISSLTRSVLEQDCYKALQTYVIDNMLYTEAKLTRCAVLDIIIAELKKKTSTTPTPLVTPPLVFPLPSHQNLFRKQNLQDLPVMNPAFRAQPIAAQPAVHLAPSTAKQPVFPPSTLQKLYHQPINSQPVFRPAPFIATQPVCPFSSLQNLLPINNLPVFPAPNLAVSAPSNVPPPHHPFTISSLFSSIVSSGFCSNGL